MRKQLIAKQIRHFCRNFDRIPTRWILIGLIVAVMISEEGMKSAELLPSKAKLFVRRAVKATHVRADVRNSEQIELLNANYSRLEVFPERVVVAQPMPSVMSRTDES